MINHLNSTIDNSHIAQYTPSITIMLDVLSSLISIYTLKWISVVLLFSTGFISGLLPLTLTHNVKQHNNRVSITQQQHQQYYIQQYKRDRYLSLGNMLSSGVFIGGGLLHLLPEANNNLINAQQYYISSNNSSLKSFPFSYLLCSIGYLTVLIIEECILASTIEHKHSRDTTATQQSQAVIQQSNNNILNRPVSTPHNNCLTDVEAQVAQRDFLKLYYARRQLTRNIVEALSSRAMLTTVQARHSSKHRHNSRSKSNNHDNINNSNAIDTDNDADDSKTEEDHESSNHSCIATPRQYQYSANMQSPALKPVTVQNNNHNNDNVVDTFSLQQQLQQPLLYNGNDNDDNNNGNTNVTRIHVASGNHNHNYDSHTHNHNHHHDLFTNYTSSTSIAYILVFALSFHSIFEGIALGSMNDMQSCLALLLVIISHTPLAGIALSISMIKANMTSQDTIHVFYTCLLLFSITNPVGIIFGNLLTMYLSGNLLLLISGCFQSFSAGTFLFVALSEIIPKELAIQHDKKLKLMLCFIGVLSMAAIKLIDVD